MKGFFYFLLLICISGNAQPIQIPNYYTSALSSNPPVGPVRTAAEWEEQQAIQITWAGQLSVLREIIRIAQNEANVLIVCSDSDAVKNDLLANLIPINNVSYILAPFNSVWCRDYSVWNIYNESLDTLSFVDWIYDVNRPKDDTLPRSLASFYNVPLYETTDFPYDFIHAGGNFFTDGFGTAFSSNKVITDNPGKSIADVDTIASKFMGINNYIKLPVLPYDNIHHIDMHMKLLDEETLLVGEYPVGIADGPQIEANLQNIISNHLSVFGTPYNVVRIPMPPDAFGLYPDAGGEYRTYVNSYFVNKTLIVPTYDVQYDTTAFRILQEALPGYSIAGIDCNGIIPLGGAIHCVVKEIMVSNPLLISHRALRDSSYGSFPIRVTAFVKHHSGINQAYIYYRNDTSQLYQQVSMTATIQPDMWEGYLPVQSPDSTVYYYIEATSNNGKTQVRPIVAPVGYWKFKNTLPTSIAKHPDALPKLFCLTNEGVTRVTIFNPSIESQLLIYNELGQVNYEISIPATNTQYSVDVMLSPGFYICSLFNGQDILSKKFVVVK